MNTSSSCPAPYVPKSSGDHRDGALVVLDHEGEEQPVELGAARGVELLHLLVGEHARHEHRRAACRSSSSSCRRDPPRARAGAGRAASCCMVTISSVCALMIRAARTLHRTARRRASAPTSPSRSPARDGRSSPDMKWMSASVYGYLTLSARAFAAYTESVVACARARAGRHAIAVSAPIRIAATARENRFIIATLKLRRCAALASSSWARAGASCAGPADGALRRGGARAYTLRASRKPRASLSLRAACRSGGRRPPVDPELHRAVAELQERGCPWRAAIARSERRAVVSRGSMRVSA